MNYKALITGILIGGLCITGASIYVGIGKRDVEVEENAYDAGLRYDEMIKKKEALGWKIEVPKTLKVGDQRLDVGLFDSNGRGIPDATVELRLYRRGGNSIRKYRCTVRGSGHYSAMIQLDTPGYWDVREEVERAGDSVRFDNTIYVQ
jgi:nitrogen fixation protein FixH